MVVCGNIRHQSHSCADVYTLDSLPRSLVRPMITDWSSNGCDLICGAQHGYGELQGVLSALRQLRVGTKKLALSFHRNSAACCSISSTRAARNSGDSHSRTASRVCAVITAENLGQLHQLSLKLSATEF